MNGYLFWVDLETTGLNINEDYILEVAYQITDERGQYLYWDGSWVIKQPPSVIDSMSAYVKEMHTKNQLMESLKSSWVTTEIGLVEDSLIGALNQVRKDQGVKPFYIAGKSVHFDRDMIRKWMPMLFKQFGHRLLDIRAIHHVAEQEWLTLNSNPEEPTPPIPSWLSFIDSKESTHRATQDVQDAIRFYVRAMARMSFFAQKEMPF